MTYSPTLNVYKNMLKLAKNLPQKSRAETLARIRSEFRKHADEADPEQVQRLLKQAASSLGYLKIVTPRNPGSQSQSGQTRIVFEASTKNVVGGAKAVSNWTGKNMDPDAVKRHYQGLKRAGFKNNLDAKGGFF